VFLGISHLFLRLIFVEREKPPISSDVLESLYNSIQSENSFSSKSIEDELFEASISLILRGDETFSSSLFL
jgi:hypothetical protein